MVHIIWTLFIEPTKLTTLIDQWNIYSGFSCTDYDSISSNFDYDPDTQISSLEECIEHCKTFDDCTAASFYDYTDSDKVDPHQTSLTVCMAHYYCDDHYYDGEWRNGVVPELAILEQNN